MLPAAHGQALRTSAQGHDPLRLTVGIGVALKRFNQISAGQAIAMNAQEFATEFFIDAGERILQQMLFFSSDDRNVLLFGALWLAT